ncbi:MAG: type I pullulanase [Bacteroidota bacterium]
MRIDGTLFWPQLPLILSMAMILLFAACAQGPPEFASFDDYPAYQGDDLGVQWTPAATKFRVWAPTAWEVRLKLYEAPLGGEPVEKLLMERAENGTFTAEIEGDQLGKYYTFQVKFRDGKDYHDENWRNEVPGPYATAVGINGIRGAILDLSTTDPEGWENDLRPPLEDFADVVLYELHVRDLSSHPSSGIQNQGKYLGLTETGTQSPEGFATGIDHIKALGVTHVHLLPVFDFLSVNEREPELKAYNWGYDPQNYNVPEGSYSTDPWNPETRIREFKQMVQALHQNGLRVVMDVVYNHTGSTENSVFNQLEPQYYYRLNRDSTWSNASACGNETASERPMMRQLMIRSVQHWAREYHIDGFRFDLMGIHDRETMQEIRKALDEIDPSILIYGEGWAAAGSPLPEAARALKGNTHQMARIAAFSDDLRDAIKGHWAHHKDRGFVSGKDSAEHDIRFGVVGSVFHPQVDYGRVSYSDSAWAAEPTQSIQYTSCHDDLTLWDKLAVSAPDAPEAERIKMHKLANAIVLTGQGIPFLHAGVEMCRTKGGNSNSYKSPDSVNALDWSRKSRYEAVFNYYRDLIALRKAHPGFRLGTAERVRKHLSFVETQDRQVVALRIQDAPRGESWKQIFVAYNGAPARRSVPLPEGSWTQVVDGYAVDEAGLRTVRGSLNLPGISCAVLFANP